MRIPRTPAPTRIDFIARNDDGSRMRYPGGKFRCYQKLVSLIPPHTVYIETHLGGGAVLRNKLPAAENIGIDRDPSVIATFSGFPSSYSFVVADSVAWLRERRFQGSEFVYADPPYPPNTRRASRCYRHDYSTNDHQPLLAVLVDLPCPAMVSSYPNEMYDTALRGWHKTVFQGTSHTGAREECVWTNYEPGLLHDTRFIGWTFRGREAWQRKQKRWSARFARLTRGEQQAMLLCLQKTFSEKAEPETQFLA